MGDGRWSVGRKERVGWGMPVVPTGPFDDFTGLVVCVCVCACVVCE